MGAVGTRYSFLFFLVADRGGFRAIVVSLGAIIAQKRLLPRRRALSLRLVFRKTRTDMLSVIEASSGAGNESYCENSPIAVVQRHPSGCAHGAAVGLKFHPGLRGTVG